MNLNEEEKQRKNAENVVEKSIKEAAEIFLEYPSYFGIEECIRNVLYAEIFTHFKEPIYYRHKNSRKTFLSCSLHANPLLKPCKKEPDLVLYYIKNNDENPVLLYPSKERKFWPYSVNIDEDNTIDKRIIIEIKFNKNFNKLSEKKFQKVINDIKKASNWDASRTYVIFFDRSNKLNENQQRQVNLAIKENINKTDLIYIGYNPENRGRYLHFKK